MTAFARYRTSERVVHYGGAWYVIRHDQYPHTTHGPAGQVTRQGHAMLVGIRQGNGDQGGFAYRRHVLPDTPPAYVPAGWQD
jgi:hypothetical protein